jgi:hypothetical protein
MWAIDVLKIPGEKRKGVPPRVFSVIKGYHQLAPQGHDLLKQQEVQVIG